MHNSPLVTSNVVVFQYAAGKLYILLSSSESTAQNTKAAWHLPSAIVQHNQTSLTSLETTLRHTIGLQDSDISYREQLYTSEYPSSSSSTICISYLYLSRGTRWFKGEQQVGVFPVDKLPPLTPADHATVFYALDRLHAKALYSTILTFLLPQVFDLTTLQQAFETVTRQRVDRRNFRKKFLALDVLRTVHKKQESQTDPMRYSFKKQALIFLDKPFRLAKGKK